MEGRWEGREGERRRSRRSRRESVLCVGERRGGEEERGTRASRDTSGRETRRTRTPPTRGKKATTLTGTPTGKGPLCIFLSPSCPCSCPGFCCAAPGMFFLSPGRAEKRRCLRPRSVIHRQWPWRYQKQCCTTQGGDDDRKRPETDRQISPHASPHPLDPYITFLRIGIASPHPPALPVVLRPPKHLPIPPRNIFSTICALPRDLSP
ncbi:hypothetical protein M432DRAFT_134724 [Thermoascus aurantiacus ATCC 26904]